MTITPDRSQTNRIQRLTLEEYLAYDDGTETWYELVDGVLVEMGAENDINLEIVTFLISRLLQFVPYYLLRRGTEIVVPSEDVTVRVPDLMVLTEQTRQALRRQARSLIALEMPAPRLVLEVVSPGKPGSDNYDRDYVAKRREYAARGIPEYWIVDPDRQVVLVLMLEDDQYREHSFAGDQPIVSAAFPDLPLTAMQILSAGQP
jgi:Uma2 family endonuclease